MDPADAQRFAETNTGQSLSEWFSLDEMSKYLTKGSLIEARDEKGQLVGAVFIGQQNPLSWPDGKKAELFILAVAGDQREQGIGTALIAQAEKVAKELGAQKIIVGAHVFQQKTHAFYLKLGYRDMGVLKDYYANGDARFFGKAI